MSDIGLKISLPGYDVFSATPEECSIHSSYPPLKAKLGQDDPHVATLSVDFTGGVTQNTDLILYQIPHGYGYVPFTISNIVLDDGVSQTVGTGYTGVGATLFIKAYCDSNYFYVTLYDNFNWITANHTLTVSYFIFAENGS